MTATCISWIWFDCWLPLVWSVFAGFSWSHRCRQHRPYFHCSNRFDHHHSCHQLSPWMYRLQLTRDFPAKGRETWVKKKKMMWNRQAWVFQFQFFTHCAFWTHFINKHKICHTRTIATYSVFECIHIQTRIRARTHEFSVCHTQSIALCFVLFCGRLAVDYIISIRSFIEVIVQ